MCFLIIPCWIFHLWICNIFWSQVLWFLQHYSFCSVLPWLFKIFCVSTLSLGFIFLHL
jgi:hypothetical protein